MGGLGGAVFITQYLNINTMVIKSKEQWEECLRRWKNVKVDMSQVSKHIQKRNSKFLKQLRKKITPSEKEFGYLLCEMKIPFIFQKGFLTPFHRIVDFYIPKKGIIIEIDGGYHNEIIQKDENKDRWFREKRGFRIIRIKNEN